MSLDLSVPHSSEGVILDKVGKSAKATPNSVYKLHHNYWTYPQLFSLSVVELFM